MQVMDPLTSPKIGGNHLFCYALLFILIASHVSLSASARELKVEPKGSVKDLVQSSKATKIKRTVNGLLEVVLVDAKGLKDTERFSGGMDPYVMIKYKTQERNSPVAKGAGSKPVWNKRFSFRVQYPDYAGGNGYKLILKLMDKDSFTADDFIGETVIYVEDLLVLGAEKGKYQMLPTKYRVVGSNKKYNGEIRVGLSFTPIR
ncbi:hypothetical protein MKW94_030340 [Papaver nudicaule]|uniref:C2 domain-containing protein n=1 Tax=Papaver nudicaule TaxID=74823 RepID=A0AA41S0K2_PAPNU|nr:hypothetical protein [Papaver nudicaule]